MKTYLIILAATGLIITSCKQKSIDTVFNKQVVCVKTATLTEMKAIIPVQVPGILSSKKISKLSFKTGGIISRILVDEGDFVRKGQLLAALEMTEISAQVQQARLAFDKAGRDLQRVKNLYVDTVATLEQFQDATSAYNGALENKNIAEFNLRYSSVKAPSDGRIAVRLAEENEMIGPGMPLFVFAGGGKDEWIVKAGVSDKDAVRIEPGDPAEVIFDAFPDQVFHASVTDISAIADPNSGTFEVEIAVDQGKNKFINGLVARVNIQTENKQLVTLVPPTALTEADREKAYVYIVQSKDTTARKIPVTIAYIRDNDIAVLERLNEIGPVITSGAAYLEEGSRVNVIR